MAELTWDEKNKLALARRAEKDYQFWATGGLTKPKHDTGGDGGPRRGGKAKFTKTQVLDDTGETLTEKNLDEDGIETTETIKTPSSVFEMMDEQQNYEMIQQPSIAKPPAAEAYDPEDPPAEAFGEGPNDLSPHFSFKEGRYLTNAEYYGTGQASLFPSPDPSIEVGTTMFGNLDIDHHGYETANNRGNLAITDVERAAAQSAIIEDYNERDMIELREKHPEVYAQVIAGEIPMPMREDPHEGKDYTTAGFDGSELHAAAIEKEAEELDKNLNDDDGDDGDGDGKNDKANDKLKYDSINTLAKEDPEKIKVLNHFASWMEDENVSDADSLRAAEDYLENLKNEPTVHDRVKKAMAIAFAAMLFGDDLTTAMNTGFGVVDDDYIAEATAEAAAAATNAELQKTVAKEYRANVESDRRKARDFAYDMAKLKNEQGVKAAEDLEAEVKARTSGNQDYIAKQATH